MADHQICRDLADARCEVAVPEERHLLNQRPARTQHAIEPPVLGGCVAGFWIEERHRIGVVGENGVVAGWMEQRVDRAHRAERLQGVDLFGQAAETGAPQQMRRVAPRERAVVAGKSRGGVKRPRRPEADLRIGRRIELHARFHVGHRFSENGTQTANVR